MRRPARKEVRALVRQLEADGWTHAGWTGHGHLVLDHPSGARVYVAGTPSCCRAPRQALSDARRAVRRAEAQQG